jgi:hypothetical protein
MTCFSRIRSCFSSNSFNRSCFSRIRSCFSSNSFNRSCFSRNRSYFYLILKSSLMAGRALERPARYNLWSCMVLFNVATWASTSLRWFTHCVILWLTSRTFCLTLSSKDSVSKPTMLGVGSIGDAYPLAARSGDSSTTSGVVGSLAGIPWRADSVFRTWAPPPMS